MCMDHIYIYIYIYCMIYHNDYHNHFDNNHIFINFIYRMYLYKNNRKLSFNN